MRDEKDTPEGPARRRDPLDLEPYGAWRSGALRTGRFVRWAPPTPVPAPESRPPERPEAPEPQSS